MLDSVVFGTHVRLRENDLSEGEFMTTRFFVYGAMTEGMVHWSKISERVISVVPARTQASAYRLKVGYPILVAGGSDWIEGQLVEIEASEVFLSLLDEFQGFSPFQREKSLFHREQTEVWPMDSDEPMTADVYFLNPERLPDSALPIPAGDWRRSLDESPALTSSLTERQVCYLRKLGAASGRDIVPINDMSLYRELMNLELIVDKGRRLALSKLGQEVVRYL